MFGGIIKAQDKDAVKLDLLKAPSSPAAQLLGFAVSEIEKPTDLSSFMLTVQSASSTFSKLPNSYAVDLVPFSLLRRDSVITLNGKNSLQSADALSVIKQSLVLSFAIRNPDTTVGNFIPKNTYGAVGIKFSIFRPEFSEQNKSILRQLNLDSKRLLRLVTESQKTGQNALDLESLEKQKILEMERLKVLFVQNKLKDFGQYISNEESTKGTNLNIINTKIEAVLKNSSNNVADSQSAQAITARLKILASKFDAKRVGLSWDVAGGVGLNFRDKRFDNSKVYNSGIWTTIGYNFEKAGSILGVARLMMNPDQIYALDNASNPYTQDINTFDTGARYVITSKRFGCGLEGIYRSIINTDLQQSTWRVVFNTDYTIAPNQKLLFSFGRNFDGTYTKSNNLIASLSLLFGFGGTKI
jgi:hypothetical protein